MGQAGERRRESHRRTWVLLGWLVCLPCVAALGLTACATGGGRKERASTGRGGTAIQEINLFSAPVALNFDGIPGPDGLSLRIYAGNPREPKSLPIKRGALEVIVYDGMLSAAQVGPAAPLHVWSYPAEDLPRYSRTGSIGISYLLTPLWGKDKPTKNRATVVVRYVPAEGPKIYSSPTVIYVPEN
jgi:hypothetical protein